MDQCMNAIDAIVHDERLKNVECNATCPKLASLAIESVEGMLGAPFIMLACPIVCETLLQGGESSNDVSMSQYICSKIPGMPPAAPATHVVLDDCGKRDWGCCMLATCDEALRCAPDGRCRATPFTSEDNAEVHGDVFTCKPPTDGWLFKKASYADDRRKVVCEYEPPNANVYEKVLLFNVTARPQSQDPYRVCGFGAGGIEGSDGGVHGNWTQTDCISDDPSKCPWTYVKENDACPPIALSRRVAGQ